MRESLTVKTPYGSWELSHVDGTISITDESGKCVHKSRDWATMAIHLTDCLAAIRGLNERDVPTILLSAEGREVHPSGVCDKFEKVNNE